MLRIKNMPGSDCIDFLTRQIALTTMPVMLNEMIETIPAEPGSYLLWLHSLQTQDLIVGRLGRFNFPSGDYFYLGSAQGSGGLRTRLGRHLLGSGNPHWHIDHLRAATQVRGFGYQIKLAEPDAEPHLPLECVWSQKLAALSEVNLPVPGFGASDCRSGCTAHLVHIPAGGWQKLQAITDHMPVYLRIR
jgi:Uri superfamily endonuclease